MADLTEQQSTIATKISGAAATGIETNYVKASANQDLGTSDILDNGGVFSNLALAAGVAGELKVGAGRLANRKYVIFQPLDTNTFMGFSSGVTVANGMPLFKNQMVMLPVGPNTEVWFINAVAGNMRIAEVA